MTAKKRKAVRDEMRSVLSHLDRRWVEAASERAADKVETLLDKFEAPKVKELLAWMSFFPGEIDLSAFLMRQMKDRRVFLPRSLEDFRLEYISIGMDWRESLQAGDYGIPEPVLASGDLLEKLGAEPKERAILVPGLAFDRSGNRIGRGKGYYDRFLSSEFASGIRRIGVCWSLQLVDQVPVEPHDVPVDWICTEEEFIRVSFRES